jgi:hypothetical protein
LTTKKPGSTADFSTLDAFLEEEDSREAFQAAAIKEVLAWQISAEMKAQGLPRKRLAERPRWHIVPARIEIAGVG